MANTAITLCRMVDKMMMGYQKKKEEEFITEGGIRERMTAARLNYRSNQRDTIDELQRQLDELQSKNLSLVAEINQLKMLETTQGEATFEH